MLRPQTGHAVRPGPGSALSERRVGEADWRGGAALEGGEGQEPGADTGGALHPAGLRDDLGRTRAVLGMRPANPRRVPYCGAEDLRADAPREGGGRGVAGRAVVGEEKLGDAGGPAADADVVPEARRRPVWDAAADDRARRLRRPFQPRVVPGGLPQPGPQPGGARGAA